MKTELQIKALAELDGWTNIHDNKYGVPASGKTPSDWKGDGFSKASEDYILPNYLTSYDAIIPLIQKQSPIGMTQFVDFLCEKILDDHYDGSDYISQPDIGTLFRSTTAQLCEALLRATNKWIEE